MAITTLIGALAGMQSARDFFKAVTPALVLGRPHSLFYLAGIPAPGVAPTPGIGGEVLTSLAGQLPFTNPSSGNTYLVRLQVQASYIPGTIWLCDRLWQNSGLDVTLTTEQVFTASAQIPARDANGSNVGVGVYGAVEVSGVVGAGTPTLTLKYTDQDGNAGATAVNSFVAVAGSGVGAFYPIGLAAGDTGIQKAESLTLSATWTSGTIHVVLFRIIARLELSGAHVPSAIDMFTSGGTRLYDNSVPFLVLVPTVVGTSNVHGQVIWTQG